MPYGRAGGVVFSKDIDLFRQALAHADRGKPSWAADFDDRNPNQFLFTAHNFHTDELSCAIGTASLARVQDTILRRLTFIAEFAGRLKDRSQVCTPFGYTPNDSPFVYPIVVDCARIACEAGFRAPVAISKEALHLCLAGLPDVAPDVIHGPRSSCVAARRLWSVLRAAAAEVMHRHEDKVVFFSARLDPDDASAAPASDIHLKLVIDAGTTDRPVATILLPDQD